eukprot:jgi/Tetstr1/425500/TSEL_015946.t1
MAGGKKAADPTKATPADSLADTPAEPTETTRHTTTLALLQALALKVHALSTRSGEHDNNKHKERRDIPSDDGEVGEGEAKQFGISVATLKNQRAEAFIITDVDGGQPTGLLYKIPAGTLCRPGKHGRRQPPALFHPKAAKGRKPRRADGTVGKYCGISDRVSPSMLRVAGMLKDAQARLEREQRKRVRERKKVLIVMKAAAMR